MCGNIRIVAQHSRVVVEFMCLANVARAVSVKIRTILIRTTQLLRIRLLIRIGHLSLAHKKTICAVFGDLLVYDLVILLKHRACAYEIPPDVHSQTAAFAFRTCRLQSDYQ